MGIEPALGTTYLSMDCICAYHQVPRPDGIFVKPFKSSKIDIYDKSQLKKSSFYIAGELPCQMFVCFSTGQGAQIKSPLDDLFAAVPY